MLVPLRQQNLLTPYRFVPVADNREFATSKQPRRPAYVSDRDPTKPRELPFYEHPPLYVPPPLPSAEPVASINDLLLRSLARSEPTEEEMLLLLAA